jgi:hypothetical protein
MHLVEEITLELGETDSSHECSEIPITLGVHCVIAFWDSQEKFYSAPTLVVFGWNVLQLCQNSW